MRCKVLSIERFRSEALYINTAFCKSFINEEVQYIYFLFIVLDTCVTTAAGIFKYEGKVTFCGMEHLLVIYAYLRFVLRIK